MFQERLRRQDFGFALFCLMDLEENPLASAASVPVDLVGMQIWDPSQQAGRREAACLPVLLFEKGQLHFARDVPKVTCPNRAGEEAGVM